MALPIEDYAAIGDGYTAALVGKDGSIDWLCLPRFDSPACMAALLGTEEHGRWLLGPTDEYDVKRRYVGRTGVLETTFTTETGTCRLTDLMPVGDGRADLVRQLTGVKGRVRMRHEWRIRLDYGLVKPWVHRSVHGGEKMIVATGGPDKVILHGDRLPHAVDGLHADEFDIEEGQTLHFATVWIPSHRHLDQVLPYS